VPFNSTLTIAAANCLGALGRLWHGLVPTRHIGRSISISDSVLQVEGSDKAPELEWDERQLLLFLLHHRGSVFTPETLLSRLWWPEHQYEPDFLGALVASLNSLLARAGLPDPMIESFHGVGYRLKTAAEAG
jgi:two-component system alkaline phosphatase synthesis response regulator PhoP